MKPPSAQRTQWTVFTLATRQLPVTCQGRNTRDHLAKQMQPGAHALSSSERRSSKRDGPMAGRPTAYRQRKEALAFLALARASGGGAENSNVSFSGVGTRNAQILSPELLIKVPKAVAADAAELPLLGLEIACKHISHASDTPGYRVSGSLGGGKRRSLMGNRLCKRVHLAGTSSK